MTAITHSVPRKGERFAILLLILVVVAKIIAQYFVISPSFDLQRDEYLHLDQANHLAWGFQSVPPFISWVSWLIKLLGNSVFWVKFFPALAGAATIVAAYYIVDAIKGSVYAKSLTMIALFFSVLFRINILFQPNSFDILAWTLVYLFLIRYLEAYQRKWLVWMAIVFAFGFLNKYSILMLGFSLFVGLLLTKERNIFAKKQLYLAALLVLIMISPNLVWQYQQGFPVVHHMKELAETQLVHVKRGDFLKAQLLFFFQAIFIIAAAFIAFIVHKPFRKYRFIGWSYVCCITFFLYLHAKDYYALGLYPVLISFGAAYLGRLFETGWRRFLKPVSFVIVILLFYPYLIRLPLVPPYKMISTKPFNKTGPHTWEDGKEHSLSQDYADMRGWKELAEKVSQAIKTLPPGENALIICDNYGQAGAINFYANLHAVSLNADYINWFNLDKPVQNLLLVKDPDDDGSIINTLRPGFDTTILSGQIEDPFAREKGAKIYLFKNARIAINDLVRKKIEEERIMDN
jgi:hypothetical protein